MKDKELPKARKKSDKRKISSRLKRVLELGILMQDIMDIDPLILEMRAFKLLAYGKESVYTSAERNLLREYISKYRLEDWIGKRKYKGTSKDDGHRQDR